MTSPLGRPRLSAVLCGLVLLGGQVPGVLGADAPAPGRGPGDAVRAGVAGHPYEPYAGAEVLGLQAELVVCVIPAAWKSPVICPDCQEAPFLSGGAKRLCEACGEKTWVEAYKFCQSCAQKRHACAACGKERAYSLALAAGVVDRTHRL